MKLDRIFIAVASLLVIAGIAIAFRAIGPPSHGREIAIDEKRLDDIRDIASRLRTRYNDTGDLPARLPSNFIRDPVTNQPYEYHRIDRNHFTLCAVFAVPSEPDNSGGTAFWTHGAGRTCFNLDQSPEPVRP
jgi:hypothetical protein